MTTSTCKCVSMLYVNHVVDILNLILSLGALPERTQRRAIGFGGEEFESVDRNHSLHSRYMHKHNKT